MSIKKLAVVASGWHFPIGFFETMAVQKVPNDWSVDMFLVSHRDPIYAVEEKKEILENLGYSRRELYDRLLYRKVATISEIETLGFKYIFAPNTIGDWGNSNQWLEKYDYRAYNKFLFTHDDNLILTDQLFNDFLPQDDWLILSNSTGNAQRHLRQWLRLPKPFSIRGSFEFFTREMLEMIGGKFNLSETTLTREEIFTTTGHISELSNWNKNDKPLSKMLKQSNLFHKIKFLSTYYRMSIYCLEGERGYIYRTEPSNTEEEERGLDVIEKYYADKKRLK